MMASISLLLGVLATLSLAGINSSSAESTEPVLQDSRI